VSQLLLPGRADVPGAVLLNPIVLLAIAIFIVNDHVLKPALGGWLPGKLSDVAGLVFFPVLVAAIVELAVPGARRHHGRLLIATACLTGLVYAGMLLVPFIGETYEWFFGAVQWPFRAARAAVVGGGAPGVVPVFFAADVTDLVTLPALIVPILLGIRLSRRPSA
jgi:hypothetical protein